MGLPEVYDLDLVGPGRGEEKHQPVLEGEILYSWKCLVFVSRLSLFLFCFGVYKVVLSVVYLLQLAVIYHYMKINLVEALFG